MESQNSINNQSIAPLARLLKEHLKHNYILVGGAALALEGSNRRTMDIDILVPAEAANSIISSAPADCFIVKDGALYLVADSAHIPIDILTETVGGMSYEDLVPYTYALDGTPTFSLPVALGVKIKTWYSREDSKKGWKKQSSDLVDILFLCHKMKDMGLNVTLEVAKMFPVGCYTMLLLITELREMGHLKDFEDVGGREFLVPWDDDTAEQREYFEVMNEKD